MQKLKAYRRKRDFKHSPEPPGGPRAGGQGKLFIVQKHDASRLHYDLRLEQDGVLRSWAVPKGFGHKPGEKRLAVEVEDHPLEYGDFEGVIPKKAYGGGTVMLWDRGSWQPLAKGKAKNDRLDFELDGQKLSGAWSLTRMGGKAGAHGKNWLLIKRSDRGQGRKGPPAAKPPGPNDADHSVRSGRSMAQIAADADRSWGGAGERGPAPLDPKAIPGARRKALAQAPQPQLASLVAAAPEGANWLHEIKFDGYRILARCQNDSQKSGVRLVTRNGKNWRRRFAAIGQALAALPAKRALLDGEVVALRADGKSSFRGLQEAISAGNTGGLVYQVFDLLHLDGYDLGASPLQERKAALAALLAAGGFDQRGLIRYTDHLHGRGAAFWQRACGMGLEGIVSKRAGSTYRAGRTRTWRKAKCSRHGEFVVGGYTDPGGARVGFGALLLGAHRDAGLGYAGRVGTGFSDRQLRDIHARLLKLGAKQPPFTDPPKVGGVHWVQPSLVVEVRFTERTRDGRLRHPAFRGLREDRDARDIGWDAADAPIQPPRDQSIKSAATPAATRRRAAPNQLPPARDARRARRQRKVAGVRLSNPERLLFPDQGVTKLDLARYYEQVADWILPRLAERPLSLLRCPRGRGEACLFQKHPREAFSARLPRVEIAEKEGRAPYVYVREPADLVALVQAGVLEIHPWGSRVDNVEKPDNLVFDLDPGEGVQWAQVLAVAADLRERLDLLGLSSFPRTTGGKGLHLVVPLQRRQGWDAAKSFARAVAEAQARDDPKRLTANMAKSKRRGRVYLDYLRNGRGATAIAAYSTRARPGAPVAVPLRWDKVGPATRGDSYNIDNLGRRLGALSGDPWEGYEQQRRAITKAMRRAVGLA